MLDDHMKFLAGTWKQEQEALKKTGLILSYSVLTVDKMRTVLGSMTMLEVVLK